jgi:hypothetical protein
MFDAEELNEATRLLQESLARRRHYEELVSRGGKQSPEH